jgi:mRNA interferase HigB
VKRLTGIGKHHKILKKRYPSASFIGSGRVIFNIKGNKYRLVADIAYNLGYVYVFWIGTHAEYDKINFEVK